MIGAVLGLLASCATGAPTASPTGHALVIGNVAVPRGEVGLQPLRYADDDALRFYELFRRASMQAYLLTVADAATQLRHPELVRAAAPPTRARLETAVAAIEAELDRQRAAGIPTVVYLYFSGHGGVTAKGEPYLALLDGPLTRAELYAEVIDRLAADRVHVIVDACNAGAVVGLRGPFDEAGEAESVRLGPEELARLGRADPSRTYPHVGFMVAAAPGRAAHEWSRIEAGVFSHEVYSAIVGGADVNGDDRVEYSEVEAFVGSANARVANPQAQLSLRARPPAVERRSPVFDLAWLGRGPFLVGRAPRALRMSVERQDGQRVLDVHLAQGTRFKLALPVERAAFVRTEREEAPIAALEGGQVELATLSFEPRSWTERGAVDLSLREGLFAEPYGPSFYAGFARNRGLVPLGPSRRTDFSLEVSAPRPSAWRVAAWIGSASALAATLAAGGYALERESAFEGAATQREAAEIVSQRDAGRDVALVGSVATGVLAGAALLLGVLEAEDGRPVGWLPSGDGVAASLGGRF